MQMFFASALLFASGVLSFSIPADHPNGVYYVEEVNGTETHIPLDLSQTIVPRSRITRGKRETGKIYWGGDQACAGYTLEGHVFDKNRQDIDVANDDLDTMLGTGHTLLGARNIYSLVGNAVSYVCNANGGKSVIVTAAEREMAFNMITAACGQNAGGWTHEDHVGIANVQWGMEGISLGGDNFCNIGLN